MGAYLDAASGAPLHPVAREALEAAAQEGWADPARRYTAGRRARLLLDAARESVAESIAARPDEISFTANGTAALHAGVLGALLAAQRRGTTLVHSAVEHSAVLHAARWHVARGGSASAVGVDHLGRVDVETFVAAAEQPGVAAAALQTANHEVGTVQPVAEVCQRLPQVTVVVDGTQSLGHLAAPDGWGVLAADARSWGGPTLGLVAVRTGRRWRTPYPEDEREAGRIPGVPDVPSIVAAAAALRAVRAEQAETAARHARWTEKIRNAVLHSVPDVELLGDPVDRLPHLTAFSCLYVDGEALLDGLDRHAIAVSSGSSCTSSTLEPSHVLVAMGALTSGNIRISLHHASTEADVDLLLAVLPGVVEKVRAELGADGL